MTRTGVVGRGRMKMTSRMADCRRMWYVKAKRRTEQQKEGCWYGQYTMRRKQTDG